MHCHELFMKVVAYASPIVWLQKQHHYFGMTRIQNHKITHISSRASSQHWTHSAYSSLIDIHWNDKLPTNWSWAVNSEL